MRGQYTKKYEEIKLSSQNFQSIIKFYLFECPVEGTSARSNTFKELGWIGSSDFSRLKKEMLKAAGNNLKKSYFPCKKDELKQKINEIENIHPCDEYCVFLKHDEKNVMQSLFSAIRNAFAHGSFGVKKYTQNKETHTMYFFQNEDKYLKAEMILREETLLRWIVILKSHSCS